MTAGVLDVRTVAGGVRIGVRVMPRGSCAAVTGIRDGRLLVRVTAAPVDGAANAAVISILAKTLGRPRRSVTIVTGHSARRKVIEIEGVGESDLRNRLGVPSVSAPGSAGAPSGYRRQSERPTGRRRTTCK